MRELEASFKWHHAVNHNNLSVEVASLISGAIVVAVLCSFTFGEAWLYVIWLIPKPGSWCPSDGETQLPVVIILDAKEDPDKANQMERRLR